MRNYITVILLLLLMANSTQAQYLLGINRSEANINSYKPNSNFRLGKTSLFNQVYFESGVKFSSESDTIGNLSNSQIGFQHQLSNKFLLFHAYNYLSQSNWWGNIKQHNYYAKVEYKFNKYLKFNISGSYIYVNSKTLASVPPPPIPPNPPSPIVPSETIINNNYFTALSSTINLKKIYLKPSIAFSQLNNLKEQHTQYQLGGEMYFDYYQNEKIVLGLSIFHFNNNADVSTLIKPSISYIINDELTINADYFYTTARNFSDQDGYIIYNSIDKTIDRTNLNLKYEFVNNAFLYFIYQFERKQDFITTNDYNFNSIFLGIKYNL